MISKLLGSKHFFYATLLMSASLPASAQTTQEVSFSIPAGADIASISVAQCEFAAPAATGAALIFNCAPQIVYSISYQTADADEAKVEFGHVQLRPDAGKDKPMIAPVRVVQTYSATNAAAIVAFNALEDAAKPVEIAAAPTPVVVATEATVVEPTAPVTNAPAAPVVAAPQQSIEVVWSASYGSILINRSAENTLEELEEAGGQIKGIFKVDPALTEQFTLSAEHSSKCSADFSIKALSENNVIKFDCASHDVALPFALPVSGGDCHMSDAGTLSCLAPNDAAALSVDLTYWKPLEIPLDNGKVAGPVPLASLAPKFPATVATGLLQSIATDSCAPRNMELQVKAYCLNDLCTDVPADQPAIDATGYLANLDVSKWDKKRMPTGVKIGLVETVAGTKTEIGQEVVTFPASGEALTAFLNKGTFLPDVALDVTVDSSIYKVGRTMRLFSDNVCSKEVSGKSLNLSNPGNNIPKIPVCSFYRIFDGEKSRSDCAKVVYNNETKTATADLQVEDCGEKRLVVMVSESSKMNGKLGKSIANSMRKLAANMNGADACMPIDIVQAADERREVMLSAEDIHFADGPAELSSAIEMSFVASGTEVLRDFEWINRRWKDTLGGVIAIIDGETTRPGSMVESPASMAWKINDQYRSILDVSEVKNCDVFKDVLLFDNCEQSNSENLEARLLESVDLGLKALVK